MRSLILLLLLLGCSSDKEFIYLIDRVNREGCVDAKLTYKDKIVAKYILCSLEEFNKRTKVPLKLDKVAAKLDN